MKKYIINGKEILQTERIDFLKKLSSEIREQIIKGNKLFPDEIDTFIDFLKTDLKHLFN